MRTPADIATLLARPQVKPVISVRQVSRALGFARSVLGDRLSVDEVAVVRQRMLEQYAVVAPSVPRLRAPMSRMTLRIAVDALVLYRSLPESMPRADRLAIVSDFVARWMRGQFDRPMARWVYAHRASHLLLRRAWFASANRLDEPDGWRFRYLRGCGLFYGVDVMRCGIVRFLAAQGAPELAPVLCRGDYAITGFLPAGVTFTRSQVLAEGAPFCDFRYSIRR